MKIHFLIISLFGLVATSAMDNGLKKLGVGDCVQVLFQAQDKIRGVPALIQEVKGDWITVQYLPTEQDDGWICTMDHQEKLHIIRDKDRIKRLGAGLQKSPQDVQAEEEIARFHRLIKQSGKSELTIKSDGNCFYRAVAFKIYGDVNVHRQVRKEACDYIESNEDFFKSHIDYQLYDNKDFQSVMNQKRQDNVWGDNEDITALSELYNCIFKIYEYNKEKTGITKTFIPHNPTKDMSALPVVALTLNRGHYNVAYQTGRTAKMFDSLSQEPSLRGYRLAQQVKDKQELSTSSDPYGNFRDCSEEDEIHENIIDVSIVEGITRRLEMELHRIDSMNDQVGKDIEVKKSNSSGSVSRALIATRCSVGGKLHPAEDRDWLDRQVAKMNKAKVAHNSNLVEKYRGKISMGGYNPTPTLCAGKPVYKMREGFTLKRKR